MRFKCAVLAFFLANVSNPLVMDQAAIGIPEITVLIPSPASGRCRRRVVRRFRRFGGMMIEEGVPFSCLFMPF